MPNIIPNLYQPERLTEGGVTLCNISVQLVAQRLDLLRRNYMKGGVKQGNVWCLVSQCLTAKRLDHIVKFRANTNLELLHDETIMKFVILGANCLRHLRDKVVILKFLFEHLEN